MTAYFCIAEALTNVAKHSGAATAAIRVRRDGDRLRVEVADDGRGGATVTPGGGLAGLVARADSVGGVMTVVSPAGGPTKVLPGAAVRVVIAEDAVLLREGLRRLLTTRARGGGGRVDADLVAAVRQSTTRPRGGRHPAAAGFTDEGLRRRRRSETASPESGCSLLSQYVVDRYA